MPYENSNTLRVTKLTELSDKLVEMQMQITAAYSSHLSETEKMQSDMAEGSGWSGDPDDDSDDIDAGSGSGGGREYGTNFFYEILYFLKMNLSFINYFILYLDGRHIDHEIPNVNIPTHTISGTNNGSEKSAKAGAQSLRISNTILSLPIILVLTIIVTVSQTMKRL